MFRYLQDLIVRNNRALAQKNKVIVSSLAPKVLSKEGDVKKVQPYLDKLTETIDAQGINNIALTGGYGSGKSTIIKTFKALNPHYSFLKVSLASFNKKKNENQLTPAEKKTQKEELERLLEVSILQQIFYHVRPSEIPESRFKRIVSIPKWKMWSISVGVILWLISLIILVKYNYLDKINPNSWNRNSDFDWFAISAFSMVFLGLGLFSKSIVKLFGNSTINKVNIKGELELGESINKSVFNEHLEEILYFFEQTDYDVVIIEDLDRFDNTDIFTKLREINILLNNSKLINRKISFIYAVGDDLFKDKKERVKFFEYIIPVIPFINSSNADEQLKTLIKDSGLDQNIFSKEFISDVTTFIDDIDMRLLTNIFHEFVIYRNTLQPDFVKKNEELFAIITYKNIDPEDFTELNRRRGKLYTLIANKKNYVSKFIDNIDEEIKQKNVRVKAVNDDSIRNITELKAVYINHILTKLPSTYSSVNVSELLEEENFNKLFDGSLDYENLTYNSNYRMYNASEAKLEFSFTEIENEVDPNYSYKQRIGLIDSKKNNEIDLLKNEIEKLRLKKSEIENWDLKQIFIEVEINEYLKGFSNNGLLRNIILNGYINENYNDYISLFHAVSITKEDFTFERNVKSGILTEYSYKLSDKIENLVDKIELRYFNREAILNFDLIDYLGNNYRQYSNKYDSIISLLSSEKVRSIQFIDEYINNEDRPLGIFIEKLTEHWKGFWEYIQLKSSHTEERENKYLELLLRFSKVETILSNQNNTLLKDSIERKANFLSIVKNTPELDYFGKVTNLLEELNVEFKKLDQPTKETNDLFEFIYTNNHYEINKVNLLQMYLLFGKDSSEEAFNRSNYSSIIKSDCEPLLTYVNNRISEYIENVFLKLEENEFEYEEELIELLNNEGLSHKSKFKIIQKVSTKVSELSSINDYEVKTQLLIGEKTTADWTNVVHYYSESENLINQSLIEYLENNDVVAELSKNNLSEEDEDFEKSLIKCNEISDEVYDKLIVCAFYNWNNIDFSKLNTEKVKSLLRTRLNVTKSNYDRLRHNFPNLHIELIEKDFKKFIENIDDFETDEEDILLLLESPDLSVDKKYNYLLQIDESIISSNEKISKIVGSIILHKGKMIDFETYTIKSLVRNAYLTESKVRLINLYFKYLDIVIVTDLLKGIIGYEKLFLKGFPTFLKNEFNDELLSNLLTSSIIKKYYPDARNELNFRVTTKY